MGEQNDKKSEVAKREEAILEFWREQKIFEKSLAEPAPNGNYIFYDGPPFATGLPHYGHILASTLKDAVPRYQTMRGRQVARRWGWDCHGLPIENIVEKKMAIGSRKEIEAIGIAKFNQTACASVLAYAGEWKKTVDRIGRWVDFDGSYKTMDNSYIESVWWALAEIDKKGLVYEGTRVLPYCPRCETPIAQSEIAMDQSYKEISDLSVYVKFRVREPEKLGFKKDDKVFLVAWTTTPWTLPGNTALAVGKEIEYVAMEEDGEWLIVSSDLTKSLFFAPSDTAKGGMASRQRKGILPRSLNGLTYEPLFDYYANDEQLPNHENGWRVYEADFVSTEEGTGIVHVAPAFGEDDMRLAKEANLPIITHVDTTGRFKPEVKDFAGQLVKAKDNHQAADVEIIKYLAKRDLLFKKEKINHSYPHCYRCETPIIYYALPSWFINIQKVKPRLKELNETINWVPSHLKQGRFLNIIEGAPDWNISRARYWASPLPIWKCEKCNRFEFIDSLKTLQERAVKSGNRYFVMRHGEAENNTLNVLSSKADIPHHLTERGRVTVQAAAEKLKTEKVDLIVSSDFVRTRETAEIAAEVMGLPKEAVIFDPRLGEVNHGELDNQPIKVYHEKYKYDRDPIGSFAEPLPGGESFAEVKRRMGEALVDLEKQYQDKKILIITHETPAWLLLAAAQAADLPTTIRLRGTAKDFIKNAEVRPLDFLPLPRNNNFELDLHRPYIDEVKLSCQCGGVMRRIPEVFDCWFESAAMPFASRHYPFEHPGFLETYFPADFVAEYIAQTRTWFYYMLVVSTILFDRAPFKHVVTTGTILSEDGQKMSKSKGNFPDPVLILDRYGADSLRFYLLSSAVMKAEDLNFSEAGVDEVYKKVISRLLNVLAFYQMYAPQASEKKGPLEGEETLLDQWIKQRLAQVVIEVTEAMDRYALNEALRPLEAFIDDLSTWYLRRSRERLRAGGEAGRAAALVLSQVLQGLARLLAPFTPFLAETVFRAVRAVDEPLSVHLTKWPEVEADKLPPVDLELSDSMSQVRRIASLALEARALAGLKVRQPLASLTIRDRPDWPRELSEILKDEINVKEIVWQAELGEEIKLDTTITEVLALEGRWREFLRQVQDLRKQAGLTPDQLATLSVQAEHSERLLIEEKLEELKRLTRLEQVNFVDSLDVPISLSH